MEKASSHGARQEIDADRLILIVTGAHLRAELHDRPLAYALREKLSAWLAARELDHAMRVLVCSDVWYLNNDELRNCPTISVGAPGVNAFGAYLADKLPTAFVVEGVFSVQIDLDFVDLIASCWGIDPASTASAVQAFCERYLDHFMDRAIRASSAA